jgi:hypothetical protein
MTQEELLEIIKALEARVKVLEESSLALRKWSDANDRYLEECVNALTENIDKLLQIDHTNEV